MNAIRVLLAFCTGLGFTIQSEAIDVAQSAHTGAHNHADVDYLLS